MSFHMIPLPSAHSDKTTNGYNRNPNSERSRFIRSWLKLIAKDRNYSRILLGLPLMEPVRPEVEQFCRDIGYPISIRE